MSKRTVQVCKATTKAGTPCRLRTSVDHRCWMHGILEKHLRVKPSTVPGAGKGLFAQLRVRPVPGAHHPVVFGKDDKPRDDVRKKIDGYKGKILNTMPDIQPMMASMF